MCDADETGRESSVRFVRTGRVVEGQSVHGHPANPVRIGTNLQGLCHESGHECCVWIGFAGDVTCPTDWEEAFPCSSRTRSYCRQGVPRKVSAPEGQSSGVHHLRGCPRRSLNLPCLFLNVPSNVSREAPSADLVSVTPCISCCMGDRASNSHRRLIRWGEVRSQDDEQGGISTPTGRYGELTAELPASISWNKKGLKMSVSHKMTFLFTLMRQNDVYC